MTRTRKMGWVAITIVLGLGLWWATAQGPLRDPEKSLADFYSGEGRAEGQLMDPLILNGRRVVPYVIREVHNKNMKYRRYAIGFLGNGHYEEALPVLEQILSDETEIYYFRADALEAIYQISPFRAGELAKKYTNGPDLLGRTAMEIQAGQSPVRYHRSYWQAFTLIE